MISYENSNTSPSEKVSEKDLLKLLEDTIPAIQRLLIPSGSLSTSAQLQLIFDFGSFERHYTLELKGSEFMIGISTWIQHSGSEKKKNHKT